MPPKTENPESDNVDMKHASIRSSLQAGCARMRRCGPQPSEFAGTPIVAVDLGSLVSCGNWKGKRDGHEALIVAAHIDMWAPIKWDGWKEGRRWRWPGLDKTGGFLVETQRDGL